MDRYATDRTETCPRLFGRGGGRADKELTYALEAFFLLRGLVVALSTPMSLLGGNTGEMRRASPAIADSVALSASISVGVGGLVSGQQASFMALDAEHALLGQGGREGAPERGIIEGHSRIWENRTTLPVCEFPLFLENFWFCPLILGLTLIFLDGRGKKSCRWWGNEQL